MKRAINTGLPDFGRPVEWATVAGSLLCTTAVPVNPDGSFETGDPRVQIELALSNLEKILKAAHAELSDVMHVMVYLTDAEHTSVLNEIWAQHFIAPYPSRGIVVVPAIGVPNVIVMMQVFAYSGP